MTTAQQIRWPTLPNDKSSVGALTRDLLRVDRSKVALLPGLRGAVGVSTPLPLAVATGQTLTGLAVAIGVLNVAGSDHAGPYRDRAERLLVHAVAAAGSVFVGAATGANGALALGVLALWASPAASLPRSGPLRLALPCRASSCW